MTTLVQDLRYATRTLRKSPGFAAAAVATLALGIGANAAIFSMIDALILKPPPGHSDPRALVWISNVDEGRLEAVSYPEYRDFAARTDVFSGVLAVERAAVHVTRNGQPERARAQIVSENAFDVVGSKPVLGRGFLPSDEKEALPAAVLSDQYWRRAFHGDPAAVGSSLDVNGQPYAVIGVAPPALSGVAPDPEEVADLFLPLHAFVARSSRRAELQNRDSAWLYVLARLVPRVTTDQASAAVATVAAVNAPLRARDRRRLSATVTPLMGWVPPGQLRQVLPFAALGLVSTGLVLLIACANVAALLLARGAGRRREVGIRLSLGATRARLVRQLLTESVLLALLGALAGLLLALWTADLLLAKFEAPAALKPELDLRVIAYAVVIAFAAALAFGLAPAWRASRPDLIQALKAEEPSDRRAGRSGARLQGGLVVAQISLSLVLLAAAGLFFRSLQKASAVPIGLDRTAAGRILSVSFDLETQGYTPARMQDFFRALLERVEALPGVSSAALAESLPLSGRAIADRIAPEGRDLETSREKLVFVNAVSPGYFATLGIPLVTGRDFTTRDRAGSPGVAIVNEALAKRFWPGEDAIGKRLRTPGGSTALFEVVGVARDGKYVRLTEPPRPFAYFPLGQRGSRFGETILLARSAGGVSLFDLLKAEVRALDSGLPLFQARTLAQVLDAQIADRRHGTLLVGIFGALAVTLASVGLYGVLSYSVTRRTREIGIRMALGAARADVQRLFLGRAGRLAFTGIGIGVALSAAVTRLLSRMLFGVTATDAATFAAVSLLLAVVALFASWLPARRATRVDPLQALRSE